MPLIPQKSAPAGRRARDLTLIGQRYTQQGRALIHCKPLITLKTYLQAGTLDLPGNRSSAGGLAGLAQRRLRSGGSRFRRLARCGQRRAALRGGREVAPRALELCSGGVPCGACGGMVRRKLNTSHTSVDSSLHSRAQGPSLCQRWASASLQLALDAVLLPVCFSKNFKLGLVHSICRVRTVKIHGLS